MGSQISYAAGAKAERFAVTTDMIERVDSKLLEISQEQDAAVKALREWLVSLRDDTKRHMHGSVCFAGATGDWQQIWKVLGDALFREHSTYIIDMRAYREPGCAFKLFSELLVAKDYRIIVLHDIARAHPEATAYIRDVVQSRVMAKYYPTISKYLAFTDRHSFARVLFVGVHQSQLFDTAAVSPQNITASTKALLGRADFFDCFIPFINNAAQNLAGSSSSNYPAGDALFKRGKYPLLSQQSRKRSEPSTTPALEPTQESEHENKKFRGINITNNNSHNPNSNNNSRNNNPNSNNPNSNSNSSIEGNNNPTNGNDNQITTSSKSHNLTNSKNKTTSAPLGIANTGTSAKYPTEPINEVVEFTSPFPQHENTRVEPYVDGDLYFSKLYEVIKGSSQEILICGWQLDPVYLKRPYKKNLDSNLFTMLRSAADREVQIKIMLRNSAGWPCPNKHAEYMAQLAHQNILMSLQGRGVTKFIYSHHQKFVVVDRKIAFVGGLDLTYGRYDCPGHNTIVDRDAITFDDNDYNHTDHGKRTNRKTHPRTAWHDVQISVEGEIVADLREAFSERWNAIEKIKVEKLPIETTIVPSSPCTAQVVRSITGASIGLGNGYKETNIVQSYRDLILGAQSYVYIENQYFLDDAYKPFFTGILVERITRAHTMKEKFIVVVVLPILPDNGGAAAATSQTIMTQQTETINRLEAALKKKSIIPTQYIKFYGLVQNGILNDKLVTSQVYVHSKVMIAGDMAMIGSANFNVRSLSGNGDSEIAVVVHGAEFCSRLVRQLLSEHAGQECAVEIDIYTFIYQVFNQNARDNFDIYNNVFGTYSAETVKEYTASKKWALDINASLQGVKGTVITFPRDFLCKHTETHKFLWVFNFLRYGTR